MVETDAERRAASWSNLLGGPQVDVVGVESAAPRPSKRCEATPTDCVVLTPEPADMTLATLAEQAVDAVRTPTAARCCCTSSPTTPDGQTAAAGASGQGVQPAVRRLARASWSTRLPLSLCQPVRRLPEHGAADDSRALRRDDDVLAGKKVLIVDDDIRNIFALTSVLERYDMVTVSAETGRDAINLLQATPDVDIVLMDIMMPEMDGIDTMRAIRQISRFKNLPIVAVTAKAMKGDREKCIEAGAWDYLSKPVDPEQMLAVLRAWLTT